MATYDYDPCPSPKHPDCHIAHARLRLEVTIICGLLRSLKQEGWLPCSVYTDDHETVWDETTTLEAVFSVDESTITFEKNERQHGVLIVLGNGVDCIPDYGMSQDESDGWNALMERVTSELYEKYDL